MPKPWFEHWWPVAIALEVFQTKTCWYEFLYCCQKSKKWPDGLKFAEMGEFGVWLSVLMSKPWIEHWWPVVTALEVSQTQTSLYMSYWITVRNQKNGLTVWNFKKWVRFELDSLSWCPNNDLSTDGPLPEAKLMIYNLRAQNLLNYNIVRCLASLLAFYNEFLLNVGILMSQQQILW